jgi:hypothetical protein
MIEVLHKLGARSVLPPDLLITLIINGICAVLNQMYHKQPCVNFRTKLQMPNALTMPRCA